MFDLNYQQSPRRLQGPLPRAGQGVCGIQTGDSPATSGSALEEPLVQVAPVGLGDIPAAASFFFFFLNLLDMDTLPVDPHPSSRR